jgi:tetratricopeptide (TPR) repeat protein
MTTPGGEPAPSSTRVEAHAEDQSLQYVAGRDQNFFTGPTPAPAAAMRTLPRDIAAFTGRESELEQLIAAAEGAARLVAIHAVNGMPGVGKTALVTRVAHLLADSFPDGQLFVDLHAHTPGLQPADPCEVLADLLACTGMRPSEIPAGTVARAERWRGRLAGKKVLLVLDDTAGHAQIEPLLPGTAGCLVLVTSRSRLIALNGAQQHVLDILPAGQAIELFLSLARRSRNRSDLGAAAELARLCGYLPLAIALLAGRLAHHPGWDIGTFASSFVATQDRVTELAAGNRPGDPAVAAAFQMSYQELPPYRQRLFRRLGLHPGPDIDAYATAALAGIPVARARKDLDALYLDHIIEQPVPGRYRLHDLIREYAQILVARNDPASDRDQATKQLLNYYQHTAQTADHYLTRLHRSALPSVATAPEAIPSLRDQASALTWMHTERANLLACIDYATTTHTESARIIALTAALGTFLLQEGPWQQADSLHRNAAATARQCGDLLGEAAALHYLGRVCYMIDDYQASARQLEQALAIYRDLGDRLGEATALDHLGRVLYMIGNYPAATDLHEQARRIYEDIGSRLGEADALHDLGHVRAATGDYAAATDLLQRAQAIYLDLGDRPGAADALHHLGQVRSAIGDYATAADLQEQALATYQDIGNRLGEANSLLNLGHVRSVTRDYAAATDLLQRALMIYRDLGGRFGEASALIELGRLRGAEVLNDMGAVMYESAGLQEALALYRQALQLARQAGTPVAEARALEGAARCSASTGDQAAALSSLREAIAIYQRIAAAEAGPAAAYLATLEHSRDDTELIT